MLAAGVCCFGFVLLLTYIPRYTQDTSVKKPNNAVALPLRSDGPKPVQHLHEGVAAKPAVASDTAEQQWHSDDELLATSIETKSHNAKKQAQTKQTAAVKRKEAAKAPRSKDGPEAFNPTVQAPVVARRRQKGTLGSKSKKATLTARRRNSSSKESAAVKPKGEVKEVKEVARPVQFANVDPGKTPALSTEAPMLASSDSMLPKGTYSESCAGCSAKTTSTPSTILMRCTCCLFDGHNCNWNTTLMVNKLTCPTVDNNAGHLGCHLGAYFCLQSFNQLTAVRCRYPQRLIYRFMQKLPRQQHTHKL